MSISILGGSNVDTSDATAKADDIKNGLTAYANDTKLTGTLTFDKFNPDYPNCLEKAKQIEGSVPLENPYFINEPAADYHATLKTFIKEVPSLSVSNFTYMRSFFEGCSNLKTVPLLDTSNATDMESMFAFCYELKTIPKLDTSNVKNMYQMVGGCRSLTSVPLLNTAKVTDMGYMFSNCNALSDESLNNILQMCANAKAYTNTKTLKYIGLSREQATKCQSLSNWQAFLDASWTSGY